MKGEKKPKTKEEKMYKMKIVEFLNMKNFFSRNFPESVIQAGEHERFLKILHQSFGKANTLVDTIIVTY